MNNNNEKMNKEKKLKIILRLFIVIIIYSLFIIHLRKVFAQEVVNNKFGIHLAQPHLQDLKAAADLVNSGGGDWGYVTLVIQENDRNLQKWQEIFDKMRELHLIPIIRLATIPEGSSWRRPNKDGAKDWAKFLDSLNWVIKNRYVILFNEPNHASEWGGTVDAKDYAQVAFAFAKALKEKNPDFFVMLAGLDASAPHQPPQFEDEEIFLNYLLDESEKILSQLNFSSEKSSSSNIQSRKIFPSSAVTNIFDYIDGWASHSYPNPGFSGSPWDYGRATVRTYQWELELLKSLGVNKQLPVFITETGWKRASYELGVRSYMDENRVAENFKIAFENIWSPDERIWAVTPFVLNYQSEPFLGFSWRKYQSEEFYPQYYLIASLPKTKGEPEREEKGEISFDLPKELVEESTYQFKIKLKNLGQGVWDKDDNYQLLVISYWQEGKPFDYFFSDLNNIRPFEEGEVNLFLKTGSCMSCYDRSKNTIVEFVLKKDEKEILKSNQWHFKIIPLPSLKFKVNLFPKLIEKGDDFEIQVFDEKENLVFKKNRLKVEKGNGKLEGIQNIIPGKKYRLVVLKAYYLPRQNYLVFQKGENKITFKSMLPLDFNQDGKFSVTDLKTLIKNPQLLRLFFL